jgi:SAM-dependent methyltransferase
MSEPTLETLVAAAEAYESLFTPALFRQWAPAVAQGARLEPGQRVLDVACGTGTLARECRSRVGQMGAVCGIDPGRGMLAVARRLAPDIEFHEGVAERLSFPAGSFDAVVSQFGLMFFADRAKAASEMLRVLAPRGRLAIAVWGALESMPAYAAEVALLERSAGKPAADALRAPFVLGDPNELAALLMRAGATDVQVHTHKGRARFPSTRTVVEADLRGWLPLVGIVLDEDHIRRVLDESVVVMRPFESRDGAAEFDLSANIATARAA